MNIRKYCEADLDDMIAIWNEIVEAGDAFPQEEPLTRETGEEFFSAQPHTGVAVDDDGWFRGFTFFTRTTWAGVVTSPTPATRFGLLAGGSISARNLSKTA